MKSRDELIVDNLKLVPFVISRLNVSRHHRDDAIGVGNIALIKAADSYDPKYNVPFSSYAFKGIRQAVLNYLKSQNLYSSRTVSQEVHSMDQIDMDTEDRLLTDIDMQQFAKIAFQAATAPIDGVIIGMILAGAWRWSSQIAVAEVCGKSRSVVYLREKRLLQHVKKVLGK